jgi:dihydroorotase
MLYGKNGRKDDLVFESVHVVDPVEGIDDVLTVTAERGVITRLEPAAGGSGKVLAPGFVDPHVHLRTPGREDEEDLASATRAAAAGGYCAVLGMPNTDPWTRAPCSAPSPGGRGRRRRSRSGSSRQSAKDRRGRS